MVCLKRRSLFDLSICVPRNLKYIRRHSLHAKHLGNFDSPKPNIAMPVGQSERHELLYGPEGRDTIAAWRISNSAQDPPTYPTSGVLHQRYKRRQRRLTWQSIDNRVESRHPNFGTRLTSKS